MEHFIIIRAMPGHDVLTSSNDVVKEVNVFLRKAQKNRWKIISRQCLCSDNGIPYVAIFYKTNSHQ